MKQLFKFMMKTYQSISLVGDPSFREFVGELDDSLAHISRQYVTNTSSTLSVVMMLMVKDMIKIMGLMY
jgi:hypothetical protein